MSNEEKVYPNLNGEPSAPPADAPPPYYPPTAGAAMAYPAGASGPSYSGQDYKNPQPYVAPGAPYGLPTYTAPGHMQPAVPGYTQTAPQAMYPAQGYPQPGPPPPYGAPAMPIAPQQHYVVNAQFDAGARFNGISRPTIPPPPPGCPPNAAQLAVMSGQQTTVIAEQKKGGFFRGSGSGGVKFW